MACAKTIQKAIVTEPRKVEIQSESVRVIGLREVRIQTMMSGISRGTEMNIFRGVAPFFTKHFDPQTALFIDDDRHTWKYPIEFGYENVGRVVEVGSDVTELLPGAVVVTYQPHRTEVVVDLDSPDVLIGEMPPVLPIPEGVSPEHGLFVPLLGVAMNAVLDSQLLLHECVVIYGAGVVGLLTLQLCLKAGASEVYVVEPIASRRKIATRLGAAAVFSPEGTGDIAKTLREKTNGLGVDVAIETSGVYAALQQAIRSVGKDGRVIASSWYAGNADQLTLGEEFHHNRVNIISSQASGINPLLSNRWDIARRTRAVLEILPSLNFQGMISHRFAFADISDAYRLVDAGDSEVLQVIIDYDN